MEGKEGTCYVLRVQQIVPTPQAHKHTRKAPPLCGRDKEAVLPCANPSASLPLQTCLFFLSSFLVLYSFEYMRKKSGRQEER